MCLILVEVGGGLPSAADTKEEDADEGGQGQGAQHQVDEDQDLVLVQPAVGGRVLKVSLIGPGGDLPVW